VRIISFMNVGGVQGMLLKTLPYFDRQRFNLRVCCTTRNGEVGKELQRLGIAVDVVPLRSRLNPFDLRRLAHWLKDARADIVHTHMYASNISGVLAARWARVPVIISHLHATHEWRSRTRVLMERFNDRFRDGYLAVSGAVRDAFLETTRLNCPDKIKVLYNISRFSDTPLAGDATGLRQELALPADCPIVGTITRLVPVKGLDILLRAARIVVAQRPEVRFVLVGKGKMKEELARLAAELGIEKNIIFAGERLYVENFYALFDLFLLSSRTEGCPNVLLEAMHFGNPIVATRVGGVPELIRDGETGLLAASESPEELAKAVQRVLNDRVFARRMAIKAAEFSKKFTRANYLATLQQYYEQLHEQAHARRPF
jgi:glycosyltransferase involved in cell wall biosynthesis